MYRWDLLSATDASANQDERSLNDGSLQRANRRTEENGAVGGGRVFVFHARLLLPEAISRTWSAALRSMRSCRRARTRRLLK